MTKEEAVHVAAVALGVTTSYDVRVMITKREEIISQTYEAADIDDLERMLVRDIQDEEREGDEIAYVALLNDEGWSTDEDFEIDLRSAGEPFSWTAVDIVKDLAKLNDRKHELPDDVLELVERAVKACNTDRRLK